MSNTGVRGVYRVENPRKNLHGYQVRLTWKGKVYYRRFSDSKYGGTIEAFRAAKAWRDEIQARVGRPNTSFSVHGKAKGIMLVRRRKGEKPTGYVTRVHVGGGKLVCRYFSLKKYGRAQARFLAQEARARILAEAVEKEPETMPGVASNWLSPVDRKSHLERSPR